MKALTFLILFLSASAGARELFVAGYSTEAKTGFHCHYDGKSTTCRTNLKEMEFPPMETPSQMVTNGNVVCSLSGGRAECAGENILSRRDMPRELVDAVEIAAHGGWVCAVHDGRLHCFDHKRLGPVSVPEVGSPHELKVIRDLLVLSTDREIHALRYLPAENRMKLVATVPVPPHQRITVMDFLNVEWGNGIAQAFFCFTSDDGSLTCRVGKREVTRKLASVPRKLVSSPYRVCVLVGEKLECFSGYALRSSMEFLPYGLIDADNVRDVDSTSRCAIKTDGRVACWLGGDPRYPKGIAMKQPRFLVGNSDELICLADETSSGCLDENHNFFTPAPVKLSYFGSGSRCLIDGNGRRTCRGGFFTFEPDDLGKVMQLRAGGGTIYFLTEKGIWKTYGANLHQAEAKFWPMEWKGPKPYLVAAGYPTLLFDGKTFLLPSYPTEEFKPYAQAFDPPIPQPRLGVAVSDMFCFADEGIRCHNQGTGKLTFSHAGLSDIEDLQAGWGWDRGFLCESNAQEAGCFDTKQTYHLKWKSDEVVPALWVAGYEVFRKERTGKVVRFDPTKGTEEALPF